MGMIASICGLQETPVSLIHLRFPLQQEGAVQLESGSIKDDVITCKFWREKTTVVQGREFDLVNTPYNLLVAAGKSLKSKRMDNSICKYT